MTFRRISHNAMVVLTLATAGQATNVFAQSLENHDNKDDPTVCIKMDQTSKESQDFSNLLQVLKSKSDVFRKRGFSLAECTGLISLGPGDRKDVCAIADIKDPGLDLYFWERFRVTPEEMCSVVRAVNRVSSGI